MYSLIAAILTAVVFLFYCVVFPVARYVRDPKGFRKYPNMNCLSGITDLSFMWEVRQGIRSKKLAAQHQTEKVIRTGPNALSWAGGEAIKDIYGHNSKCTKDTFYERLAGTHFHLADVVNKPEHARKRKVLSSAYALKNLEGWEYKVADKAQRFVTGCDKACTLPLKPSFAKPDPQDLTFDYRMWANLFTLDAIADIGLSERLGFLDQGSDLCTGEKMDGTLHKVNYRVSLHSTARAQTELIWSYDWYKFFEKFSRYVSPHYRALWKHNENWNDIVYHRATQRLERYRKGEKLDDFFQA